MDLRKEGRVGIGVLGTLAASTSMPLVPFARTRMQDASDNVLNVIDHGSVPQAGRVGGLSSGRCKTTSASP